MLPAERHKQAAYSLFPTAPAMHREPSSLATVNVTIFNRSPNVKAFLAISCLQAVAALLPEKPVQFLTCTLRRFIVPGMFLPVSAPEEIAKITGFAITHRLAPGLPAPVGGMGVMKCAIAAASHVAAALRADVPPAHHAGSIQLRTAAIAPHHGSSLRLPGDPHEIFRQHHVTRELPLDRTHHIITVAGRV